MDFLLRKKQTGLPPEGQGFRAAKTSGCWALAPRLDDLANRLLKRLGDVPGRVVGAHLAQIAVIADVIAGAVLLSFMPELLRYTVEPAQKALFGKMLVDPEVLRMLIFGLALVLTMRFSPAGLWPESRHRRELNENRA